MNPTEYQQLIKGTDNRNTFLLGQRCVTQRMPRVVHYILGLGSETGELQDAVKKYLRDGRPIDPLNVLEECGDIMWYVGQLLAVYGFTFEQAMQANIDKLTVRYPDGFTEAARTETDLTAEYDTLKKNGAVTKE